MVGSCLVPLADSAVIVTTFALVAVQVRDTDSPAVMLFGFTSKTTLGGGGETVIVTV